MKKLLLLLLGTVSLCAEPAKQADVRFDLLVAIKSGDRAMVEDYCKNDNSLDVSRHISSVDDTPVHMAIRALVSEHEKQADYEKTLKNFGLWAFIGTSIGSMTYYYKDRMWQPVAGSGNRLLEAVNWQDGVKRLANLSGNVLLMTSLGTIIYMAARKLYFAGQTILRDRQHWNTAEERVHIVELLIGHPSFDPTTINNEGLTPLDFVKQEREKVHHDHYLARVMLDLEDQIMAQTRKRKK